MSDADDIDPYDENGNALCYTCLDEVVDQEGEQCPACEEDNL